MLAGRLDQSLNRNDKKTHFLFELSFKKMQQKVFDHISSLPHFPPSNWKEGQATTIQVHLVVDEDEV